jgi:hypothetical protein
MGLSQAAVEMQRRQELRTLDWDRLDHEFRLAGSRPPTTS